MKTNPCAIISRTGEKCGLEGKMANWTRRFSRAEVEKGLAKLGVSVNNLQAIEPVTVGPSGRLIRVRLVHHGKRIRVRSRPVLTGALKLPEILVEIRQQGDHFVFKGRGLGHGVGYSQWSGAGMGKKGRNYREILAYYYSGAELKRLWYRMAFDSLEKCIACFDHRDRLIRYNEILSK